MPLTWQVRQWLLPPVSALPFGRKALALTGLKCSSTTMKAKTQLARQDLSPLRWKRAFAASRSPAPWQTTTA